MHAARNPPKRVGATSLIYPANIIIFRPFEWSRFQFLKMAYTNIRCFEHDRNVLFHMRDIL